MKKLLLLLAIAVALSLTGYTQTSGTSQSGTTTGKTTTQKSTTEGVGQTAPKPAHLTGCLAKGPEGSGYVLTNGKYTKGVAVKSSEDISAHVGHEVKLTGTWEKPAETTGAKEAAPPRTFEATSLKHISDTCTAATAGGKKGGKKAPASTPPAS